MQSILRDTPADMRRLARYLANKAWRHGTLVQQPCEHCGSAESIMHHADYSQPLAVNWLCRKCHGKEHKRMNDVIRLTLPQKPKPPRQPRPKSWIVLFLSEDRHLIAGAARLTYRKPTEWVRHVVRASAERALGASRRRTEKKQAYNWHVEERC